jgi:hypothetical protein
MMFFIPKLFITANASGAGQWMMADFLSVFIKKINWGVNILLIKLK